MMNERPIFVSALQKSSPVERSAYLDSACANDPALRQRVEALLAEGDDLGSFLESPALAIGATLGVTPITEGLGAQIGRYKLIEQIGEGGFGVVYLAEQQKPVRRHMALKIIKPG